MSATVIDALMVTMGLDISGYKKNMDTAEKKRDDFERKSTESSKHIKDGFAAIRNEVLLLGAAFTAGVGIKDFFSSTINNAANLGYLSASLSMTTEKITAYQRASERAGGSTEGMTAQLKESVDTLAQLKLGMGPSESLQWFFRMGGNSSDLQDGNTYLMARAKIIHDMFLIDPGKAALMAKQMGIVGDQFDFVKQGPEAMRSQIEAQEKHSAVTKKDAEAAQKLRVQMLDLRDSFTQTATRIVLQLAPELTKLFAQLEKGGNWIAENKDVIKAWVESAIKGIKEFAVMADRAAEAVGGWKNVLILLAGLKVVGMVSGFASVAASIAGVGVAAIGTVPALVAALGALSAYAGYKLADKLFGTEQTRLQDQNSDIMKGGTGGASIKLKSKSDLKAEAERQRIAAGLDPLKFKSKDDLKAEADRQWRAAGLSGKGQSVDNADAQATFARLEKKHKLPAGLLDSVWETESARGKNMLSPAGAMGHFQFMPKTAAEFNLKDPYDLNQSADAAARKLEGLLKQYNGNVSMAAAAYNWGQGNLDRQGMKNAPAETKDYVDKIAAGIGRANAVAASNMPVGSTQSIANRTDNSRSSTSTSDTTINGGITIVTQATDMKAAAKEIKPAIEKYNSTMQANTGIR